MYFPLKNNYQKGQALLAGLLLFAAGTSVLLSGIGYAQTKDAGSVLGSSASKQSFFSSESALEDGVYRLKTSKTLGATDKISIGGSIGTASINGISNGEEITSQGTNNQYQRNTTAILSTGQNVPFIYGIQAGTGGLSLAGSSGIYGNVYANSSIESDASGFITGTAVAANAEPISDNQSNTLPLPPTQDINMGLTTSQKDFAQSVTPSATSEISEVGLYLKEIGNPPQDLTVDIVPDAGGVPGASSIAEGTISEESVTSSYTWINADFSSNPILTAGTTYWIVLSSEADQNNHYAIGGNTTYMGGFAKIGHYQHTWMSLSPSNLNGYFNLYLGGAPVSISGPAQSSFNIGESGIGDAYADTIVGVNVAGNLYCQAGSLNSTACDTSRADPLPATFPVSQADINQWAKVAVGGGTINGDEIIGPDPNENVTLGPTQIDGNLTVNSGGTLTISGTLYVTGNIDITGGSMVKLASGYGASDGVIVTAGTITIDSGSSITGSGTSGSSLMLLTTSASRNAISLSGGSGAMILNAQNGTVNITGGTSANQVSANAVIVSGDSSITYQNGLINSDFSNGSLGGYSVLSWQETP